MTNFFKKRLTTPLLKCLNNQQADYIMWELHEGIYDLHKGGCSLATRVVHADYYWSTLKVDALDFTRRYIWCLEFADVPRTPLDNLHSLSSLWPFSMWEMDILEPFPKAPRQIKFLLVTIHYFTKWIEARPLREISTNEVEKFTWKHLICVYGLLYAIIIENKTQFKA